VSTTAELPPAEAPAAGLARRLATFLYEGVLLFGIVMGAGLVYGVATDQRHALVGAPGLRVALFVVLGVYFVYFWTRRGQTLAMQTWHIRLVGPDGRPPSIGRASARYLLAWLWFLPALLALWLSGLTGGGAVAAVIIAGVLGYAALARLHPGRQYLHDVLCGTRLVHWQPAPRR
jgi:uncharacterized RDD family membrane protein YckC